MSISYTSSHDTPLHWLLAVLMALSAFSVLLLKCQWDCNECISRFFASKVKINAYFIFVIIKTFVYWRWQNCSRTTVPYAAIYFYFQNMFCIANMQSESFSVNKTFPFKLLPLKVFILWFLFSLSLWCKMIFAHGIRDQKAHVTLMYFTVSQPSD